MRTNMNMNNILNGLIKATNIRLPVNNTHYVTLKDLSQFSKLMCVENELSKITYSIKNGCNKCLNNYFR